MVKVGDKVRIKNMSTETLEQLKAAGVPDPTGLTGRVMGGFTGEATGTLYTRVDLDDRSVPNLFLPDELEVVSDG